MNKFNFNKLTPFKWFVLENFPFIEADFDALTEWQLFCKLGKEINKIIDSQNLVGEQAENLTNAFIELQNYVNDYFKNLDVQDEINNKLNEMTEDGTLQSILASVYITPYSVPLNRIARIVNSGKNGEYSNCQGFHFNGLYFAGYRPFIGETEGDLAKIVKYDNNFNVLNEVVGNFGHANSITSDEQFLYITTLTNKLYKLNIGDLSTEEIINTEKVYSAIAYKNNKFYLFNDNDYAIYKTNNFVDFEKIQLSYKPFSMGASQGLETDGKYLYLLWTNPNCIAIYNLEGKFIRVINFPVYIDNIYCLGEVEDLSFYNGEFYMNSNLIDDYNKLEINQIFKFDLYKGTPEKRTQLTDFNRINPEVYRIYVDYTNKNINPNGTFSNPFTLISEAIDAVRCQRTGKAHIILKNNHYDEIVNCSSYIDELYISYASDEIVPITIEEATIKNCKLYTHNIIFNKLNMSNCEFTMEGYGGINHEYKNCKGLIYGTRYTDTLNQNLYGTVLNGVSYLDVTLNDFGCIYNNYTNLENSGQIMNIGDSIKNSKIEKAKLIVLKIKNYNKLDTFSIIGNGEFNHNIINNYAGSAGWIMTNYNISRIDDTLTFNNVRDQKNDGSANTINTPNTNYQIIAYAVFM